MPKDELQTNLLRKMHILVVNDDGPPSCQSSPYVHAFVRALQDKGHLVSVVLPHVQRSWIGKAHFVHQLAKPTYFRPGRVHEDDGTTHQKPLPAGADGEEWVLVDGTPATCAQLGLYHFYQDRGPVDIVVSGPNFGRNSTALFSLSSGTVGGAMEGAVCGHKAVALSFAFSPEGRYLREPIEAACRLSARLVEYLEANWDEGVDLYNVNVPLLRDVEFRSIKWTDMLANKWKNGSSFQEVEVETDSTPSDKKEAALRSEEEAEVAGHFDAAPSAAGVPGASHSRHKHRNFKWSPSFKDVHRSVVESKEGNDGWAISQDFISVTPLRATFMLPIKRSGDLKLEGTGSELAPTSAINLPVQVTAFIKYEDEYVQPLIETALKKLQITFNHSTRPFANIGSPEPFLQISPYESIDHELLLKRPSSLLANSYTIRKALIRKEYLASIVRLWASKNPDAILSRSLPDTIGLQLDYAEFLDDAMMEGDGITLMPVFENNEQKSFDERTWWMVKASMADRGQGIRLFSTFDELQAIFEGWEGSSKEETDSDYADDNEGASTMQSAVKGSGFTSNLRHFVLQQYISPFLLSARDHRKFHIRCYVVAVGALKVYVYRDMLALFSSKSYDPPSEVANDLDLSKHLTNTCLQDGSREGSVERFWGLPEPPGCDRWKKNCYEDICQMTGQLFQAAKASPTDFQPLPNAFELYGVDWLVGKDKHTDRQQVWLLEVNAFPDMKQTGTDLKDMIAGLWEGIFSVAVAPFFNNSNERSTTAQYPGLDLVFEEDMKR